MTDAEVLEWWRWAVDEGILLLEEFSGTNSIKFLSGAGLLRADITLLWEMADASIYERVLAGPELRPYLGRLYNGWDLVTATRSFRREATPESINALSGTG